ncbi:hypothetical protein K2173_025623 [Erythroxylum novogranatense]|uniref:Uncharacterized protein n=1 Tax=Erythroxylum novogranatense TaxID=1862640 RepID=A0AAV8SMW4_9ROSI|nr:hypothetical protein K2173_025623 [Erythroxylum novogranatense]
MALNLRIAYPHVMHFPVKPFLKVQRMAQSPQPTQKTLAASFTVSTSCTFDGSRKLPVLLFDIMDTIVRDPFYHDVPPFFGMSFKELIECKHPTAWIEFEKGMIDEMELSKKFFKDGRPLDLEGLKNCMKRGYSYLNGVEELLHALKQNGYEMHALTNYPIWYKMIEDKLNVSTYMSWTFCSCNIVCHLSEVDRTVNVLPSLSMRENPCFNGKRKPDHEFFMEVLGNLKIEPGSCIFIDDRLENVQAAIEIGIVGLHFKDAELLREDLSGLGIYISTSGSQ